MSTKYLVTAVKWVRYNEYAVGLIGVFDTSDEATQAVNETIEKIDHVTCHIEKIEIGKKYGMGLESPDICLDYYGSDD